MILLKTRTTLLFGAFLLSLLLGPLTIAANAQNLNPGYQLNQGPQQGPHGPPEQHRDSNGSVWINTDIITIMADGGYPMLHFWYTSDENGTRAKFMISYTTILEFQDHNGDGAFQSDERLFFAPLAAYDWTVTTGSVEANGTTTEVWLKYTKGGVRSGGMMPGAPMNGMPDDGSVHRFEDVTMQIWAHIYLTNYTGSVTDDHGVKANFTVAGGSELKMDITIGNFPFSSETSSVAIQTMLRENEGSGSHEMYHHRFETRERLRHVNMTSDMNWTTGAGNESMFERMNGTDVQRIQFMNDMSDVAQGFFSWVDQAVITLPGGATEAVNVTASYMPMGMGVAVYLAYPNFDNGTLTHDPSIGLYESGNPITTTPDNMPIVLGIGLVAAVAIAVVVLRRKQ